jgi:hypothetical protein
VVAKVKERPAVNKETTHKVRMERFNLKKLNEVEVRSFGKFDPEVDFNEAWEPIKEHIKISAKSLGYYELNQHKPLFNEGC